jgi:aspartate/methionine/tyrosine aminotransferase
MPEGGPGAKSPGNWPLRSPFARLRDLLQGLEPGGSPLDLALGEPQGVLPEVIGEQIYNSRALFARYPDIRGSGELRSAIAGWLRRRYGLPEAMLDAGANVLPVNGSREGLFYAILAARRRCRASTPTVLVPNPSYPVYRAAAVAAGAEPVPIAPGRDYLPDLVQVAMDRDLLGRTAALVLCSPSNPEGSVAPLELLAQALVLARRHDFLLIVDECYSEIYRGAPPPGALAAAGESLHNLVVFNSLSKRSSAPGLRSGYCAGDEDVVRTLAELRNVIGPQMPGPIQRASAALWSDESHVETNRLDWKKRFALADRCLEGLRGYRSPRAGFFLWLELEGESGVDAARRLWGEVGLRVLPGEFLGVETPEAANPSEQFIRVSLTPDPIVLEEALPRLRATLDAPKLATAVHRGAA